MNRFVKIIISLSVSLLMLAGGVINTLEPFKDVSDSVSTIGLTSEQRQSVEAVIRESTSTIWFEENIGQFAEGVRYGFRTTFGSMLIYDDHLQIIARQTDEANTLLGTHSVNVLFVDGNNAWQIVPGGSSEVIGTYQQPDGSTLHPEIYKELTLRNVYDGVDLRLYSAEKGTLEFDWLLARAQDYNKIQMQFLGQDGIRFGSDGSMTVDLRYQDLALNIPESYQIINGEKIPVSASMASGDSANVIHYELAGGIVADQPLVIDPTIVWATYFDLNNGTLPFDSYNYAVAVNATGVYIGGWIREDVTNGSFGGYMDVNAGFSQDVLAGQFENYIYRFNGNGTAITAWTSTGIRNDNGGVTNQKIDSATNDAIADMELFPDGRVLVGFASGLIQIYSSNLSSRSYSAEPVTMDTLNAVAPVSNSSFYTSGRVSAAIPAAQIPAVNIGPDTVFAGGSDGVIIRYSNATTTPTPDWATYVGGNGAEYFTAIALTPNGSNLVFTTNTAGGAAFPALVNAVDNTIVGTELLVGVLPEQATVPAAFSVFSYLGGDGDEGTLATDTTAAVVTATDTHFYVAGSTASPAATMPGTAGGGQAANGGGAFDAFVSRIPINGSAGAGFQTTFLGGDAEDRIGGIAYDKAADQLLVFGTTGGGTFPVLDTTPGSDYYDGTFGGGTWDIFVAIFNNTLTTKLFATFIGGTGNDYLGQTGDLIGQGHVTYSSATGLSYLATTVHSTLPANAIGTPPGKDSTKSNGGNDTHTIFAFNINNYDYGDAPLSYDGGSTATAARSAISSTLRIGLTTDVEALPFSGATALGDDQSNTGSSDDEDGITTINALNVSDTTYSATVSVFNNSGAARTLQGWVDFNLDGAFQVGEYASVAVPSSAVQQSVVLNWAGITVSGTGQRYLRLRLNNGALTDNAGTLGVDERSISSAGTGEVEDYSILPVPQLSKAFSPSTIPTGSSSTLTITIVNPSATSAQTNLAFSDTFPAGMVVANPTGFSISGCGSPTFATPVSGDTSISFTGGGTIAAGGTCTVTVDVTVSSAGAYINDNLTVSSANGAGTTSGAILDANTTSLVMTKTASPVSGTTVNPGDPINYTITITNTGTTTQNNIVVNDVLPAGTTYVAQSTVANGYIVTTSNLTYLDQFGAAAFNNSNGTANWAGTPWTETNDNGVANTGKIQINTATAGVARFDATAQADVLTLTRPVNLTDAIAATLTYTLTETGNNNTTGAGGDYIEVEVYNGTTWTNLTTQNQNFTTFNGNHNVLAYANANTQIRFIVHGYDGGTNDARLDNVQIAYTMQSSPATIKDNIPAGANGDLTGGVPSTLVTTADDFDLLAGQSMTVTYSITVDNPATETSVDNTALVTSVEQVLPLQSATSHPISAPQADLGLTKTNGVSSVTAGGATTYSLTVTNSGLGASSGTITVVDVLPTGLSIADGAVTLGGTNAANWTCVAATNVITCTSTTAIAGAGGTSIFSFSVNVSSTASGTLLNPAQVGGGGDPTNPNPPTSTTAGACTGTNAPTEGCATDSDTVNVVNLGLTKSNGTTTVTAGGTTTYTLIVTNSGNTASSGAITVVDVLPTGLTIANGAVTLGGAQAANWACTAASNVITCTSTTAITGAGGTSIFSFPVNVSSTVSGTLLNPAQVGGGSDPTNPNPPTSTTAGQCTATNTPNEGCATDSDTVNIVNLGLTKSNGTTTVTAGGTTTYALTVSNSGNTASSGAITVVDVLPTGLTIANGAVTLGGAQAANWTCTAATNVITCTSNTSIAASGNSVFNFTVNVDANASGTLLNPAQVGGGGDPTNPTPPTSTTAGACTGTNAPTEGCATDSDTVNVVNLGLTKSNGTTTVTAGGTTTYTLAVTNSGNTASSGTITIVDVLPTGLTISNGAVTLGGANAANWTCTAATNVITCASSAAIAASGTSVFNFTINVDVTASGTLLNPAQVGGGGDPTNPTAPTSVTAGACTGTGTPTEGCATDSDTVNVVNLGLAKTNSATTVTAGGTTTYSLTVTNSGNTASSGTITVVDVLPTGMTIANGAVTLGGANAANWTCTAATNVITCTSATAIASGGSSVFSFPVTVSSTASGTLLNPAQVGGGGDPTNPNPPTSTTAGQCTATNTPNEGCAVDSDTVNVVNLGLTKSNGATTVTAGGTTTYTLTVTNSGNTASSGTISVVDVLPTGLTIANGVVTLGGVQAANWTCTAATNVITCTSNTSIAASGGTSVFNFTVNVDANASGTLLNPAQVGGGGDPTNPNPPTSVTAGACTGTSTPTEGCAVDSDTVNVVNLGLTKSNGTTTVTAGGTTTYTLTVSNTGNTASSGTITVVDVLPTGLSIANGSVTLGGTNAANWTCTAASNVITCTSSTVINASSSSVFSFTVNVAANASGTLLNPAQVGGGGDPTNPNPPTNTTAGQCIASNAPNEGCATDSDTVNIVNLGLTKSNGTTTVTAGGTTTYTLTVTNSGNTASSGTITVVDVLPIGLSIADGVVTLGGTNAANWACTAATNVITCTSNTSIAGSNGASVFSFTVNVAANASGTLLNPAQVGGGGDPTNPNPPTNTTAGQCTASNTPSEGCATDSDTVDIVDLGLAKTNGASTVVVGGTTTYVLTITNSGNMASSGVITVVDVLPTGLTITNGLVTLGGADAANWTCTAATNVITCTSSTPIAGSGGTSVFNFTVNIDLTATGSLVNRTQVGGGGDPTNPNPPTSTTAGQCTAANTPNEGCAVDIDNANAPDLSLSKSNGANTVTAGGTTTYTLTVTNTGSAATSSTITILDVLPTGLSIADGSVTLSGANSADWICAASGNVITCTSSISILGGGATSVFGFPVNVDATASGTLLNRAQVGGGGDPGNPNPPTTTTTGQCSATDTPNKGCATDSDSTNVVDLGLAKTNGTTSVLTGNPTTYTLTVTNLGNIATTGTVTVVDVLPVGLSVADGVVTVGGTNSADWTCTAATNVITCTSTAAIAGNNGTSVFNFTVSVDANASGTLVNRAQVGGGGDPTNSTPPTSTTAGTCTGTNAPAEGCATDTDGTTPSASVTGVVFNDADLNGSKAASEAGLVGVIVNLFDSTGTTLIATTTTTTGGVYNFLNLPPGDYRVIEIDPAGYVSSTPNNVPVTVPAGGTGTANFGDYQLPNAVLSSISGVVYNDLDGDGVQDPGEPSLSGVTVDLKNNLGVVIGTVITNASGAYTFSSLPAGSYTVVETDPSGFTSTTLNNVAVTLSAGTSATVNFGDQQPAGNPLIADPAVTKLGSPTNAQVGDAVVYTITVGNNGNTNATNVVLTDTKPSFLDIISVTIVPNPGLTPVISGNTFTINFGTVTPTDFYTITVLTRVNTLGVPPGGVNNASIVTSSNTDRTFNNASAAALTIPDSRTPPTAFAAQAATQLPATGFAPNRITDLPAQPNDRLYAPTNVTLEIPRLGVKVSVVGVPQTDGAWDVAWLGKQAGWLEGSAFPSWNGNSVLTGHVFDANGKPGPFVGLNKLKYGDQVIIRFNGQKYVFEVRTNQSVSPTDTSAFKHEERSWVTLITCKEYDPKTNTYKQRVVVRAVLVSVEADR